MDYALLIIEKASKKKEWQPEHLYIETYIPTPSKEKNESEKESDSDGIIIIQMI